ncbi:hypothetical protein EDB86DRAFT_2939310 [Lactarius hatsudake]|nr:hypothetical protein EDB86DRAFT_2939310 [Lactarius hatsudake]
MPIALLAVVVILALYVVLPQCVMAPKVEVAVVAGPMRLGIFMLLEGTVVWKPPFTPIAVCHDCGGQKRRV